MANLEHLRCFVVMAETLSFTETARRLRISQPSVTRQIRRLEDAMGAPLFVRDRHRVQLSRDGMELRGRVAPHLTALEEALEKSREEAGEVRGKVTLGCLREIGQHLFAELLVDFQKRLPGIDLRVRFLAEDAIVNGVRGGALDFGVTSKLVLGEAVRAHKLLEERIELVTRASNRAPARLEASFVGYDEEDALLTACLRAEIPRADLSRLGRLTTVNSHRAMIQVLLSRDCFAALPRFSIRKELEKGQLRVASEKSFRNTLYLLHPEAERLPKRHLLLKEFLIEHCGKRLVE